MSVISDLAILDKYLLEMAQVIAKEVAIKEDRLALGEKEYLGGCIMLIGELSTTTFGDRISFMWTGSPIARTDYPTLLYLGKCELPLDVGSKASLGRYRVVVMAEEPETATVLVRRCGLWGWLHEVAWRLLRGR